MERKTIIGLAGSILLFVGVFMPIVSLPIIGSINYFGNGKSYGTVVLVLAATSLILILAKKHKWLLLTGSISIGLLSYTLLNLHGAIGEAKSDMESEFSDNPFKGLGSIVAQSVQIEWGWAVMFVGAIMLIIAAIALNSTQVTTEENAEADDRQSCLYCAEAIKTEATVCGFCGRDQPIDALPELVTCGACGEEVILGSKARITKKYICNECSHLNDLTVKSKDGKVLETRVMPWDQWRP